MNLSIQYIHQYQYLLPRHQFEYERVVLYVAVVVLLVLVTLQAAVILGCGVRHWHMVTICTRPVTLCRCLLPEQGRRGRWAWLRGQGEEKLQYSEN